MKIVHNNDDADNGLARARNLEKEGDLRHAAEAYEKLIRRDPVQEFGYDRLMIIYRKEKNYKKEMSVIRLGIKTFEQLYRSMVKKRNSKIKKLSNALLKSTGLTDTKGKKVYEPEPIARWNKRKKVVEQKLGY